MKSLNKKTISLLIILFFFVPSIYLLFPMNNSAPIESSETSTINALERIPYSSNYWTPNPIYITGDNWSASGAPWIQVGAGTISNPHIIENVTIDGGNQRSCIQIENSNDYFIIRNCSVYNALGAGDAGINLINVVQGMVSDNFVYNNYGDGIRLSSATNNITIENNWCFNNSMSGIYCTSSENNTIKGNQALNNTSNGITLYDNCLNFTIEDNVIANNSQNGILLQNNCSVHTIRNNNIFNNSVYGISFSMKSNESIVIGNKITSHSTGVNCTFDCKDNLFYLNEFRNNTVQAYDQTALNNKWNSTKIGNYWDDYTQNDDDDNGIGDNPYFLMGGADSFPIWDDGNNGTKIHIDGLGISGMTWSFAATRTWCTGSGTESDPYILNDLTINANDDGNALTIENTDKYFIVSNGKFTGANGLFNAAIYLNRVSNGSLIKNNCSYNSNSNGIYVIGSKAVDVIENVINYNGYKGVWIYSNSDNITLYKNTIDKNNQHGIEISSFCDYINISHNNIHDQMITGITVSSQCNNITIDNNDLFNKRGDCVNIKMSNNISISHNKIYNSSTASGIYFENVNYSKCFFNNITLNGNGISIKGGVKNKIYYNIIDGCRWFGIELSGGELGGSKENIIKINDIMNCDVIGLLIQNVDQFFSRDNLIYLNKFSDNKINAVDNGTSNEWDNGTLGNYWDDYNGCDDNGDGIGESPYNIPGTAGAADNKPITDKECSDRNEEENSEEPKPNLIILGYDIPLLISIVLIFSMIYIKRKKQF
ncbi:MAG: right-handed parallel beta-helix repeat-containing protein [Promethearchaeota archaeon]